MVELTIIVSAIVGTLVGIALALFMWLVVGPLLYLAAIVAFDYVEDAGYSLINKAIRK